MRDEDKIRKRLLEDCQRPSFARLARYTKEVDESTGETVTRPSVKFVEAALARWGYVNTEIMAIEENAKQRTIKVFLEDREAGSQYSKTFSIARTILRRAAGKRDHNRILSVDIQDGRQVFLLSASEEELTAIEADQVSIAIRQLGLRILPADLVAECMDQVAKTIAELDPDKESAEFPHIMPPSNPKVPELSRSSALAAALKKRKVNTKAASKSRKGGPQAKKLRARK